MPIQPVLINRRQWHHRRAVIAAIILTWGLLGIMVGAAQAEDAEDKLGNWLGVNSTVRFSDRWSLFGQGEVRFWEAASDLNETLFRIAGHYDINQMAMVGLGYVRVDTWPYDDDNESGRERIENRLYQQFAMKQSWHVLDSSTVFGSSSAGSRRMRVTVIPTGGVTGCRSRCR